MKPRTIRDMIRAKEKIERGEVAPARVWDVRADAKGRIIRRALSRKGFQRAQKISWGRSIMATRQRLGLSQTEFARLLGISVRTLHHWEQGTRTPTGAARVLLRIAALNPELVLKVAA